jgi:hypothetical protein
MVISCWRNSTCGPPARSHPKFSAYPRGVNRRRTKASASVPWQSRPRRRPRRCRPWGMKGSANARLAQAGAGCYPLRPVQSLLAAPLPGRDPAAGSCHPRHGGQPAAAAGDLPRHHGPGGPHRRGRRARARDDALGFWPGSRPSRKARRRRLGLPVTADLRVDLARGGAGRAVRLDRAASHGRRRLLVEVIAEGRRDPHMPPPPSASPRRVWSAPGSSAARTRPLSRPTSCSSSRPTWST